MAHVTILGAGVVGLTVALSAKACGHIVAVKAEQRLGDKDAERNPFFASAYPAASVIPHSVPGKDIEALLGVSHRVFDVLRIAPDAGVGLQKHFELFEDAHALPFYRDELREFAVIENGAAPIARHGAAHVAGYSFESFFCDMPIYGAWLVRTLEKMGIGFERVAIDSSYVRALKTDVIVNCLGSGAHRVYDDIGPGLLHRGVLLRCPLPQKADMGTSYNYTPAYAVYPGFGGQAADVYFYPRHGDCVLGGMRQAGSADAAGAFRAQEPISGDVIVIDGIAIPKPILELNRELVSQLTGATLAGPFHAFAGYRHIDGTASDPRLTIAPRMRAGMAPHIDCLGFGGAGVTLSWGAALRVVNILDAEMGTISAEEFAIRIARIIR